MRQRVRRWAVSLLFVSAACADDVARTTLPSNPTPPAPTPLGVYTIAITGIATGELRSTVTPVRYGDGKDARATLTNAGTGLVFEPVSTLTLTQGARGAGGQKYVSFTYRVRNGTGSTLNNVTALMVSRSNTISGTPISVLRRDDGTAADPAIASYVVPTGAVTLRSDQVTLQAVDPDVVQVFQESEVAAITLPGDVTGIFPYGLVVRSATPNAPNRTLPAATSPNQFGGVVTLSFRLPLQTDKTADVNAIFFEILAVQDSETRLTESMEEAQDSSAVRRLRERAAALGATTVTVLPGSPAAGPDVADYPGQRQICSVRTAGTAASPVTYITTPAAYTRLELLRPGESSSACGANFRSGTPTRPTLNSPYSLTVKAMDRYGNVITGTADTVALSQTSGPTATFGAAAVLASGQTNLSVTYQANGTSLLNAVGRRVRGERPIEVAAEATVAMNGGDNQAAMAGSPVPTAPSVLVRDLSNQPLAGVPVTFTVTGGGGYVTGATAVTNASGVATVGRWVLGSPGAPNTLRATAAGAAAPATFTATGCSGGGGTGYGITLCFRSAVTPSQRAAFEAAAARWQQVVVGDLPDLAYSAPADSCGTGSPSFNLSIDDLVVFASVEPIDGPLLNRGLANTCYVRAGGGLPFVGYLRLDSADIVSLETSALLQRMIEHELGHVLGIGALWAPFGLVVNPSPSGGPAVDTYYAGAGGRTGFDEIGGTTYTGGAKVPVENTGVTGRVNVHWRENVLALELMTPSVNAGAPLSLLTVRALADLGYSVDTSKADAYFLTLSVRAPGVPPVSIDVGDDVEFGPLFSVDARGRTRRLR